MKKLIAVIIIIICLGGVIYSSYKIIKWKSSVDDNNKIKEVLEEKITQEEDKYNIDFKSLKEENPDTVAYIKVNNANIDYIVVKGEDNEYYLNHNFNKEYNIAGWIFSDYHNKFDETDKNIVIFGHNMKDGSMFGSLNTVLNELWQSNEENKKVVLVTEKNTYYYEVFSVYSIKPEDYYIRTSFNENEFEEFVKTIKSRTVYDFNVDVSKNDKILTLSSCIGDGTKRVVLHAKLL